MISAGQRGVRQQHRAEHGLLGLEVLGRGDRRAAAAAVEAVVRRARSCGPTSLGRGVGRNVCSFPLLPALTTKRRRAAGASTKVG